MISTGPAGVIFTVAVAFGKHAWVPAETTMFKKLQAESRLNRVRLKVVGAAEAA